MEPAVHSMEIPGYVPLLAVACLLAAGVLWMRTMRCFFGRERSRGLQDNPLFLATAFDDALPAGAWSPPARIVCSLAFIFLTACLQNILTAGAALLFSLSGVFLSGASFRNGLRRLGAMGAFLGMLLAILPFTVPTRSGDTVLVIAGLPGLAFNVRGLAMAGLICLKATAISFAVEIMIGREPFPVFLQAIETLGVPQPICRMIALVNRYMFVFGDEAGRMLRGMHVRGFRGGSLANTARAVGNLLGMLFVRSLERTERVHEAMVSRGFSGRTSRTVQFSFRAGDWAKGLLITAPGLGLLLLDRFWLS